jgi:hypothetical protein
MFVCSRDGRPRARESVQVHSTLGMTSSGYFILAEASTRNVAYLVWIDHAVRPFEAPLHGVCEDNRLRAGGFSWTGFECACAHVASS